MSTVQSHSVREEIANALTHGVGATAALAGGAVLITLAARFGDGWQVTGAVVFGCASGAVVVGAPVVATGAAVVVD